MPFLPASGLSYERGAVGIRGLTWYRYQVVSADGNHVAMDSYIRSCQAARMPAIVRHQFLPLRPAVSGLGSAGLFYSMVLRSVASTKQAISSMAFQRSVSRKCTFLR